MTLRVPRADSQSGFSQFAPTFTATSEQARAMLRDPRFRPRGWSIGRRRARVSSRILSPRYPEDVHAADAHACTSRDPTRHAVQASQALNMHLASFGDARVIIPSGCLPRLELVQARLASAWPAESIETPSFPRRARTRGEKDNENETTTKRRSSLSLSFFSTGRTVIGSSSRARGGAKWNSGMSYAIRPLRRG